MNKDMVLRLARYRRLLGKLKSLGLEKVFSNNLGDGIGVTPALVRKDFSMLNLEGHRRGGYDIDTLMSNLDEILGHGRPMEAVIVGCGKIGTALLEYPGFARDGIKIAAGFDLNPDQVKTNSKTPIYPMDDLINFIRENNISVGVITVPDAAAAQVLDMMLEGGIKGILNFAPVDLKLPKRHTDEECTTCLVHNVNIALEIENIFYLVNQGEIHHSDKE